MVSFYQLYVQIIEIISPLLKKIKLFIHHTMKQVSNHNELLVAYKTESGLPNAANPLYTQFGGQQYLIFENDLSFQNAGLIQLVNFALPSIYTVREKAIKSD